MDELVSHKTNVHKRIQCTYCPDIKLVVDLNKHLKNLHGIVQNSMCEHCGQVYANTRCLQVQFIYFFIYSCLFVIFFLNNNLIKL